MCIRDRIDHREWTPDNGPNNALRINGLGAPRAFYTCLLYTSGSLRDDFNFGPAQLFRTEVLKSFDEEDFDLAGYYALQLHASREGTVLRIPEFLFSMAETDLRKSGEKQFDYEMCIRDSC